MARPLVDSPPERAAPAPRSPKRRAKRGRAAKLQRKIDVAGAELADALLDGHDELAARIEGRLDGLDVELRTVLLEKEHEAARRLARKLGISIEELARIAARRDRAHGPAPDENPAATGSPYRGVYWRSALGRGGKGATAR